MHIDTTRRPDGFAVTIGLLMLVLTACSGDAEEAGATGPVIIQGGAPGGTSRVLTPEEAESLGTIPFRLDDVAFMQGMIHHHGQALAMTQLAATQSGGDQIPVLARRMEIGQEAEVDLMVEWLHSRGFAAPSADPADHIDHYGPDDPPLMPGMLTLEQFDELRAATGPEFDRLFLEYMIQHHLGALQMVDELVEAGGGQEADVDRLAQDMYADQEIEILRMQELLAERSD